MPETLTVPLTRRRAVVGAGAAVAAATLGGADAAARTQNNMHEALDLLRAARTKLENAAHNKGGHRAKAITLVDDAIAEVRRGIAFADG